MLKRWFSGHGVVFLLVAFVAAGLAAAGLVQAAATASGPALQASAASVAKGGRLYDNWWKEAGLQSPAGNQALWATQTTNARTGTDTWRCKECHGWDYLGKDGAYGSGSHKTGFVGVSDAGKNKTLEQLTAIMKGSTNPGHNFSAALSDPLIGDLASFLKEGLIDPRQYIDYATKKPKQANVARGKELYATTCAACHGADGTQINFGSASSPEYVGTVALDNPQEFLNKVRFGQPGTPMPAAFVSGWSMQDVVDVLGHAQTLPTVKSAPVGTAAAGKTFWNAQWCQRCHGVNAEGGYGPDLAGRGLTFQQLARAIRQPWGVMPAYTTQQVSDQNIADLVAYFNSLSAVAEPGPWRIAVPAGAPLGQRLLIDTAGCGQCHGAVLGTPRRAAGGAGADFAWFEELVYEHTSEFPTGRMGNYSEARLTEETLRTIWTYISQDLGLRVPVSAVVTGTAAADGTVTYNLTLQNTGQAGKGLAMGNIYISMIVPAGSSVVSASTSGYQGVQRFAPTGTDIAVWLAPRLGAQDKLTYTVTVTGSGAAGGSNAFVRWLSPTRWQEPGVAGDFILTASVRP